jgi:hypothetical protein
MRHYRHQALVPSAFSPRWPEIQDRKAEGSVLLEGAIVTALVGLGCGFAAVLGHAGCGSTDGSFVLDDPGARPNGFCRLTHFPGFPDTLGSALFAGAVYLIPVAVVAVGTVVAAATGRRAIFRISLGIAALLTLVVLVATIALSRVDYVGVA